MGGSGIPAFDIDLMRGLSNTVGRGDDFRPIMACHYSACGGETPCVGYVVQEGERNLAIRIMAMRHRGDIDWTNVQEQCRALDLWPDFHQMLEAYEEAAG